MAGRVAEIIALNKITTGAANDFEKATEIAHNMVCQYGMSDLGPLSYGDNNEMVFLGRELTTQKNFSEKTAELIDSEVKKIVTRNYERSDRLLKKHITELRKTAEALLEKEVLSSDDIDALINGRDLPKKKATKSPKSKSKKTYAKKTKDNSAKKQASSKRKPIQTKK